MCHVWVLCLSWVTADMSWKCGYLYCFRCRSNSLECGHVISSQPSRERLSPHFLSQRRHPKELASPKKNASVALWSILKLINAVSIRAYLWVSLTLLCSVLVMFEQLVWGAYLLTALPIPHTDIDFHRMTWILILTCKWRAATVVRRSTLHCVLVFAAVACGSSAPHSPVLMMHTPTLRDEDRQRCKGSHV